MNTGKNEDRGLFPLDGDRGYSDTYHQDQFPTMPSNTSMASNNASSTPNVAMPNATNTNASASTNVPMLTGPIPSSDVQSVTQPAPTPTPSPTPNPPVVHSASKMSDWNYVFFFGGLILMIISAILFFAVYNAPAQAISSVVPK